MPALSNLPKDPRTLLKTPRSTETRVVPPGTYCHFGLESGILGVLKNCYHVYEFKEIKIKVGVDGLPVSESNGSQLWPILGCIYPTSKVFLVGAYHGFSKPADSNEFLSEFVGELQVLINNGIIFDGNKFNVLLFCIVCDAPAKAFVTKTKGHAGYFGCSKCMQEGEYHERRMCFPEFNN